MLALKTVGKNMDKGQLRKEFERAGLAIRILERPERVVWPPGGQDVFTLSVAGSRSRGRVREEFRVFPCRAQLKVLDLDSIRKQLVLMVREEEQEFHTRRAIGHGRFVDEAQRTSSGVRKYLVGLDERSYFVAELPRTNVTTVSQAREALKSDEVRKVEERKSPKTRAIRQGEWFFVPATREECDDIERSLTLHLSGGIRRKISLGGGGKPHVADESFHGFARGAIRHPDHRTVYLPGWHRVHRNAENRPSARLWID